MRTREESADLFEGTAWYYFKYRPQYPKQLFEDIVKSFSVTGEHRLLDLGCGPGNVAVPFAPYFKEVVAIDPSADMIATGKKAAKKDGISNITWIEDLAENISSKLGTFRVTTMGASFHWMDQETVLRKIHNVTEDAGGIAIFANSVSPWRNTGESWKAKRKEVVEKYLGTRRRAGSGFFKKPTKRFEDVVEESPFHDMKTLTYSEEKQWALEEVVNYLYSTSFASKRLLGSRLKEFEDELREELLNLNQDDIYKEIIVLEALLAWK